MVPICHRLGHCGEAATFCSSRSRPRPVVNHFGYSEWEGGKQKENHEEQWRGAEDRHKGPNPAAGICTVLWRKAAAHGCLPRHLSRKSRPRAMSTDYRVYPQALMSSMLCWPPSIVRPASSHRTLLPALSPGLDSYDAPESSQR